MKRIIKKLLTPIVREVVKEELEKIIGIEANRETIIQILSHTFHVTDHQSEREISEQPL